MRKMSSLVGLIWLALAINPLSAQTFSAADTTLRTCSGQFTDSGGLTGAYRPNERRITTFCSDASPSTHVRLDFTEFALGQGDRLCFFDGPDTNSTRLLCTDTLPAGKPFAVQATIANSSGCLTVVFQSDATSEGQGWKADIRCVPACQPFYVALDSIIPAPKPGISGSIDICPGQSVFGKARGIYPFNNLAYNQADTISRFNWDFGDNANASGNLAEHLYAQPGGFFLQLTVTDQRGCTNLNPVKIPIRVAPRPIFTLGAAINPICPGETVRLSAAISAVPSGKSITVAPGTGRFASTGATFSPEITNTRWRFHPTMFFQQGDSIAARPDQPGLAAYLYIVQDTFGCLADTMVTIPVRSFTSPECGNCLADLGLPSDTAICSKDSLRLNLSNGRNLDTAITFLTFPQYQLGFANHPPSNPYAALLPVDHVAQEFLTDPQTQIEKVCIDITTDWDEDLAIFLRAPTGQLLELSTSNGGGFDNYTGTCFTPTATTPITAGTAPFTGNFQPEGNWNVLQGASIKGNWALLVSDEFEPTLFGRVESWSITFLSKNQETYAWAPTTGISCTDCANPVIKPAQSTPYRVTVTDLYGCTISDTIRVNVQDSLAAPVIECAISSSGTLIFRWNDILNARGYQVQSRINNGSFSAPQTVTNALFAVNGLYKDDRVEIQVTANPAASLLACGARTGIGACTYQECNLSAKADTLSGVSCFGLSDGGFRASASGGTGSYTFRLSTGAQNASGQFSGLRAGSYTLVIQDSLLCSDTITVTIPQPDSIRASLRIEQGILCYSQATGIASLTPAGGTAPYSVNWSNGQTGNRQTGLSPGNYRVSVTDAKGCSVRDSFLLTNPDSISLSLIATQPSCSAGSDGRIALQASGGTGILQYSWNNGSRDSDIRDLRDGIYCVTVSDANGCQTSRCATLSAPTALKIDSVQTAGVDCFGQRTGRATVFASGGTAPYRYLWSDSLAQISATAINLQGGTARVTVTDSKNCSATASALITQPAELNLQFTATDAKCREGADGTITPRISGGQKPYSFSWSNTRQDSVLQGLKAGTYTLTVTDAKGCQKTGSANIKEPAAFLTMTLEQTFQGCFAAMANRAKATAAGGLGSNYSFRWSNGFTGPENVNLDSLRYTVTVTDGNGCQVSDSIKLKDQDKINPNMIINQPSCFGGSNGVIGINFIEGRPNADLTKYTFRWSTGETGLTIGNLKGDQTYSVTVTDPQGCVGVESRVVKQPKPIQVTVTAKDVSCANGTDGEVGINKIEADSKNFTYRWDIKAGGSTVATVTGLQAGTYSVTVTDEFSCFGVGSGTINQPKSIDLRFTVGNNRCFGDTSGSVRVSIAGGTAPYSLLWSNGAKGTDLFSLAAGVYSVTVTDSKNCKQAGEAEIKAATFLEAAIETRDPSCNGSRDGAILITPKGGKGPYQYSIDGKTFRASPTIIGLKGGNYDVIIRDANGCQLFQRAFVKDPDPFVVDAGAPSYTIRLGDSLRLGAYSSGGQGPVTYQWLAPYEGTLSCIKCDSTTVRTQNTINYELFATDEKGCEASDRVIIYVRKERIVEVPTGFTPNNDGNNDLLLVHGLNGTQIALFQVYDRWGELVYERRDFGTNDESVGWDGAFRNKPMPPGVYIWYLEATYVDGFKEVRRGQTTLIR